MIAHKKKDKSLPRLLILYASAGAGHMQAAKALKAVCEQRKAAIAETVDMLDYAPGYFRRLYRGGYLGIVKRIPELWGYLYDRSYKYKKANITTRLHHLVGNMHITSLLKHVRRFNPDALIFTHFLGWDVLAGLKRITLVRVPFYCVVTDFAVHSLWIHRHVSRYYVASEGEKRLLMTHNIKDSDIMLTGIPVHPRFAASRSKKGLRKQLKLDADIPVVLMISGRYNLAGYMYLLSSFKGVGHKLQILVLTGKNRLLASKMRAIAKTLRSARVTVLGMVDNMHELMAVSDIVISKPGGLTTSEVLASKTLMAVIDPIPGQEQRNSDYLLESGVAIRIHDMESGGKKIADLLANSRRLSIMRRHLKYVSRPYAAYDIIDDVTSRLSGPKA